MKRMIRLVLSALIVSRRAICVGHWIDGFRRIRHTALGGTFPQHFSAID